jgi:hypothetical protein
MFTEIAATTHSIRDFDWTAFAVDVLRIESECHCSCEDAAGNTMMFTTVAAGVGNVCPPSSVFGGNEEEAFCQGVCMDASLVGSCAMQGHSTATVVTCLHQAQEFDDALKIAMGKSTEFFTAAASELAAPASFTPAVCNEGALAFLMLITGMPLPSIPNFIIANMQGWRLRSAMLDLAKIVKKAADTDLTIQIPDFTCTSTASGEVTGCRTDGTADVISATEAQDWRTLLSESAIAIRTLARALPDDSDRTTPDTPLDFIGWAQVGSVCSCILASLHPRSMRSQILNTTCRSITGECGCRLGHGWNTASGLGHWPFEDPSQQAMEGISKPRASLSFSAHLH